MEVSDDSINVLSLTGFINNNNFYKVYFNGFTFTEALKFVETKNCQHNITLPRIQYFCGTNPLLLSFLDQDGKQSVSSFKDIVKEQVKNYIKKHLQGLMRKDDTLESYFMREELLQCSEFVNDASMEVTMTADRIKQFEQTFLYRHRLVIVDDRETRSEVQEDQDFLNLHHNHHRRLLHEKLSLQCSNGTFQL